VGGGAAAVGTYLDKRIVVAHAQVAARVEHADLGLHRERLAALLLDA